MVCEVTCMALHLRSRGHNLGAEERFLCGTRALQVPVFCSLQRFLLDVEWPFNDFSFLTSMYILSFQLTDKRSSLLSIFTMCFAYELNLLIRC